MLETPAGPISETGAILLWLADTHQLGPSLADPDRPAFLKWLFFLSNTAHAELRQIFYPHQYAPADGLRWPCAVANLIFRAFLKSPRYP